MERKRALILEFKSKNQRKITIQLAHFKENLSGAVIKEVMENLLASGAVKIYQNGKVEEAESILNAYYSVQIIENIIIQDGDIQEQLKL